MYHGGITIKRMKGKDMIRNLQKETKVQLIDRIKELEKSNEGLTDALDYYRARAKACAGATWTVSMVFILFVILFIVTR